jgi:DNA modification methylase
MQIRTVHPFPARMAPELALRSLESLPPGSIVLDPMAGSGTVLRQAMTLGHNAIGFDMDPLAVLMSQVWTTRVAAQVVQHELNGVLDEASQVDLRVERAHWHDDETRAFIEFWFAGPQRRALTRLAIVLDRRRQARLGDMRRAAVDVLQVALSRIIITKEQCASLARDTSHSRPHRVADSSAYDVNEGFERSALQLAKRIEEQSHRPIRDQAPASVHIGDARKLILLDHSVDAIMTSPPYLNAIDYMRGHRMSLVWLGHRITDLRSIRSNTIGAERGGDADSSINEDIANAMCDLTLLPSKHQRMVRRYADDLHQMMRQAARVLRPSGTATYVLGNSCLKDAFIRNSDGVARAAHHAGLTLVKTTERDLPASSRYLPITDTGTLSKRMRTETILSFRPTF